MYARCSGKMHAILHTDMHKFKLIFNSSIILSLLNQCWRSAEKISLQFVPLCALCIEHCQCTKWTFSYKMYLMSDIGITISREYSCTYFTLFYTLVLLLLLFLCSFHLKSSDFYPFASSFSCFLHAFIFFLTDLIVNILY